MPAARAASTWRPGQARGEAWGWGRGGWLPATIVALLLALPAWAESIVVPASLPPAVAAACPDCEAVLPCGDPDVQYGRRFMPTAMQGDPPRAYLLAHTPLRKAMSDLLGRGTADELAAALADRAAGIRLLAIEQDWATVRLLVPAAPAVVKVDPAQQACFADPARGLGCCLGDGPRAAGCLPKADPPSVVVQFRDGDERLTLRYPVGAYEIRLGRGRAVVYWCHGWAAATLVPQ